MKPIFDQMLEEATGANVVDVTPGKPVRVQLRRMRGWRMPENTVIVARPSPWGNPFRAIEPENREHVEKAVMFFRRWLLGDDPRNGFECGPASGVVLAYIPAWTVPGNLRAKLADLKGKNLACWCKPGAPCHADVLLELANQ